METKTEIINGNVKTEFFKNENPIFQEYKKPFVSDIERLLNILVEKKIITEIEKESVLNGF